MADSDLRRSLSALFRPVCCALCKSALPPNLRCESSAARRPAITCGACCDPMDVQVPVDTGIDTGAASTGDGPQKGLSASCSDIICKLCNERIWHDGQPHERIRKEISRHMNANGGRCRPDGTFKPAKEAKTLMEQMITNRNIFEVRGARGCDFLQRTDPPDAHQCSGCSKLFPTLDQANRHMQHTKCKQARPSSKATPVHCHITIGGTLVRALPSTRRRLDSAFAAAPATPAIRPAAISGTEMAGAVSTGTIAMPTPAFHQHNSGEYMHCMLHCAFDIFCKYI